MTLHKPSPTLADVAALAKVSTATVSRCMNFPDQVAHATRSKVLAAVQELGYSPNFGARAMAAQRTNTIGAIIPTMENAVFARGLQAFQEELRAHGFTMLVASSSYRKDVEEEQIRALVARGADGLLLIGHDRSDAIYQFLQAQRVPTLVTWAFDRTAARPSVGFDNCAAMQAMAQKVLAMGHRRLALVSAPVGQNDRARARHQGIIAAMDAAGVSRTELTLLETPYGIENGAIAFEQLMKLDPHPTAVFCGNDVLAVGALRRAREMGVHVPDDVSIVGFDDIDLAQVTYPALTTVHVPHREMGKHAARLLANMVLNGADAVPVELQTALMMRGSLGSVGKGGANFP